jgi:G3E family GTPase
VSDDPVHRGAWGFTWISDRPFHPERLHHCLEDLGLSLRGRGTVHLASRPDLPVEWDSVGSRIALGAQASREAVGVTAVSFVGVNGLAGAIRARLADATLSDAEMAAGAEQWRTWPDPFDDVWRAHIDTEEA